MIFLHQHFLEWSSSGSSSSFCWSSFITLSSFFTFCCQNLSFFITLNFHSLSFVVSSVDVGSINWRNSPGRIEAQDTEHFDCFFKLQPRPFRVFSIVLVLPEARILACPSFHEGTFWSMCFHYIVLKIFLTRSIVAERETGGQIFAGKISAQFLMIKKFCLSKKNRAAESFWPPVSRSATTLLVKKKFATEIFNAK